MKYFLIIMFILFSSCTKNDNPINSDEENPITIMEINPSFGSDLGNTLVKISGENFHSDVEVTFGDVSAGLIDRIHPTLINVLTPPNPIGIVDVEVSNPNGNSDKLIEGFEYIFGLFNQPQYYPVTVGGLVGIDLDNDGDNDLITSAVSILMNNGDGTFAEQIRYDGGDEHQRIIANDFDGDENVDIAITNNSGNKVSVFINNGVASFSPKVQYEVGPYPVGITCADLDEDGDNDLITANSDIYFGSPGLESSVSVLMNNGDGTFAEQIIYDSGIYSNDVSVADLDNDGDVDVVVATDMYLSVLMNNGDGTLADRIEYQVGANGKFIKCSDLNNDDNMDVVIYCSTDGGIPPVSVLLNNGDGTFAPVIKYEIEGNWPQGISIADLDGDGDNDIAATSAYYQAVAILLNNGDGTFTSKQDYLAGKNFGSIYCIDLDGDGDNDIAAVNEQGIYNVSVLLNRTI